MPLLTPLYMKSSLTLRNHPLLHRKRQRIVILADNVRTGDLAVGCVHNWHG